MKVLEMWESDVALVKTPILDAPSYANHPAIQPVNIRKEPWYCKAKIPQCSLSPPYLSITCMLPLLLRPLLNFLRISAILRLPFLFLLVSLLLLSLLRFFHGINTLIRLPLFLLLIQLDLLLYNLLVYTTAPSPLLLRLLLLLSFVLLCLYCCCNLCLQTGFKCGKVDLRLGFCLWLWGRFLRRCEFGCFVCCFGSFARGLSC